MSSSDESEAAAAPQNRRKRKSRRLASDDTSGSGSPVLGPRRSNRVKMVRILEDSSSSDSDDSVVMVKRKKVGRVTSDSEDSSSSGSIIVKRPRNVAPLTEDSDSQWETDFTTDHEIDNTRNSVEKPSSSSLVAAEEKAIDSDSSDGLSEKCPICLVSFRLQEIGVPESCEHSFCLECIQEWSKNVNTCPVDRKEYNSLSVKKSIDGAVDRKIGVEKPQVQNEMDIVEDPTFCEICGSNDNEDRLLLCDGCRRRFHLRCVPGSIETTANDSWRCNACVDEPPHSSDEDDSVGVYDISDIDDEQRESDFDYEDHNNDQIDHLDDPNDCEEDIVDYDDCDEVDIEGQESENVDQEFRDYEENLNINNDYEDFVTDNENDNDCEEYEDHEDDNDDHDNDHGDPDNDNNDYNSDDNDDQENDNSDVDYQYYHESDNEGYENDFEDFEDFLVLTPGARSDGTSGVARPRPVRSDCSRCAFGCNLGYHLHCLNPPLEEVPFGSWYCQECLQNNEEAEESDLDSSASDIAYSDAGYDLESYIGCDLGFHLYCLTPSLQDVPEGAWFCNDCSPDDPLESELRVDELFRLLDEANLMFGRAVDLMNPGDRRRGAARLLPRTTQVERIRRRIANNRRPNNVTEPGPSTSTGRARSSHNATASTSRRPKKTNRRKKSNRTTISYKTVYEIDEVTGEAVAVKKRVKTKKRKSRTKRATKQSNYVNANKKPAAGCRPDASNFEINEHRRHNAGIPSLDLFGNTNRLDYFSDSEGEESHNTNGQGILLTRTANLASTANAIRRVNRRKGMLLESPSSMSNATDILGSIMDTQEKFLSKNAVLTVVDSSGKLEIQQKGSHINQNNNLISSTSRLPEKSTKNAVASKSDDRVDVNSSDFSTREAVFGSRRGGRNRGGGFRGSGGYNSGGSHYNRRHDEPPSYSSNSGGGGPLDFSRDNFNDGPPGGGFGRGRLPIRLGDGDFNTPQDYTRRTLLERENFDRPRRDERNERNFPPRFQDDFRRPLNERDIPDDFRRPLNERDFPPRFENEFRRDRDQYSPPPFHEDDERDPSPPSFHENNERYHDDRRVLDDRENSLRPLDFQRRRSVEFEPDGPSMRPSSELESGPPPSLLAPPPPPPPAGFPSMSSGPPSLLKDSLPSLLSSASIPPPPLFPGASGPGSLFPIGGPPAPLFPVGVPPQPLFPVGGPPDFQHGPPNFTSGPLSDFSVGPPPPNFEPVPPPNFESRPPHHFESGPPPLYESGPPPHYESGPPPRYESGPPLDFESAPPPHFESGSPSHFESGPPPGFQCGPLSKFESGPPPNFESGSLSNFESGLPPNFESGPPPNFESGPPPNFESGPPPNFESGPPPHFESGSSLNFESGQLPNVSGPPPNFESGPPLNFESGPLQNFESEPPPSFESEPPTNFKSGPPSNFESETQPNFESEPPTNFKSGPPPSFESGPPPNFESGPTTNFETGSPLDNSHAGNFVSDPADYESVPPNLSSDSLSNIQEQTPCTLSNPDFTSDSPPREGIFSTQSYSLDKKESEDNSAPPETYMPDDPYMPHESEEETVQEETSNKLNDNSNERKNYSPNEAPDEYNPEECTQGSDNEVDIYSDIEEEQSKRPNNPENTMLPPAAPVSGISQAITPSSVPYTPSKPLSPRAWSPKRPYSPPRSYSPSFPTSPPRTLDSDMPYTPSKTFSPNRTPERPSQVEPGSTGEPYSPTANSDGDSENEMVIDTEKVQEEHREEQSTTDDKAIESEAVNEVDNDDGVGNNEKENGDKLEDDQSEPHDENWEKDSDDGKKVSENMWDETPAVHKPKSWDEETPSFTRPKTSNWENETPALHPRPPPKSIWEREEDELGDGCPNFSIYSRQSKSVALTTDLTISQTKELLRSHTPPTKSSGKEVETTFGYGSDPRVKILKNTKLLSGLYSDSEDESVVKKSAISKPKGSSDKMTEDIVSEEERSYTPCRDENAAKQGLEGLDTEMVSEDERNEFEATTADGDALEINAKDSELDLTRPQDCEEGEILDKSDQNEEAGTPKEKTKKKKKDKVKEKPVKDKSNNKENDPKESFKKISKSNKDRNYRSDRVRSKSPKSKEKSKSGKDKSRDKKRREKRREIERYDVRAVVSERPKKDAFGRDIPEKSRSRSYTPPLIARLFNKSLERRSLTPKRRTRSPSPPRRSARARSRSKRRSKSRGRKRDKSKRSRSRTRSRVRRKDKNKNKKRKRSPSKSEKRREGKNKRRARGRSKTPSRPAARQWTPSLSPSPVPMRMASPSWTPPRATDPHLEELRDVINESLTVMLDNTSGRPRRERPRREKRRDKTSRRRRERTPPPSKEVFASGDNILVSVSFNNENEEHTRNKKRQEEKEKKKRRKEKRKNKNKDTAGVKPVAIIDLDRSPFLEVPVSPKEVIVLSDSDHQDAEASNMEAACDSQQVASPETRNNFSMGPKTPPEPQVKFSLSTKPSQMRVINNPLHDPEDDHHQQEPQEELNNSQTYKGPNTPPEPPSSPPSSPDAYDPFEPTKSRSVTPEPSQTVQSNVVDESHTTNVDSSSLDITEKLHKTPEITKSLTPPMAESQPADSQSSIAVSPKLKSPEQRTLSSIVSQVIQATVTSLKPVAQTTPFSSDATAMITSTPISTTVTTQRINILNSTVLTPTIPQRIVLPNQIKPSPVKISPTKAAVKSTPVKPMPKVGKITKKVSRTVNGSSLDDITIDLDSPYSPASSDYDDLFDPPQEVIKPKSSSKIQQSHKSVFDTLFGSPSVKKKSFVNKFSAKKSSSRTKHVGVKIDEDSLKILDDLPNSAVEMQVKDKFLKKLNRQERVVEEVKLVLKPFYNKKKVTKDEYKEIMRRAVPKICHNKTGEINPNKIRKLVEAYVKKIGHNKKVTSSSSLPLIK